MPKHKLQQHNHINHKISRDIAGEVKGLARIAAGALRKRETLRHPKSQLWRMSSVGRTSAELKENLNFELHYTKEFSWKSVTKSMQKFNFCSYQTNSIFWILDLCPTYIGKKTNNLLLFFWLKLFAKCNQSL